MTEMSKTQVHAILKEPEPVGRWYSQDKAGKRKFISRPASVVRAQGDADISLTEGKRLFAVSLFRYSSIFFLVGLSTFFIAFHLYHTTNTASLR